MFDTFPENVRRSNLQFAKFRFKYIIQKLNENGSIKCSENTHF